MRVLAPGKLVLVGEYAVLDGVPAWVLAVDRGVSCEQVDPGGPLDVEVPDGDDRFASPALAAGGVTAGRWRFSSWNPVNEAEKVGFGGSAAAVVAALTAARASLALPHDPAAVTREGIAVHERVQGGGSGIDVAASAFGGILRFTREPGPPGVAPRFTAEPHPGLTFDEEAPERGLEAPFRWSVVYSGASAKTGPRVARYLAWDARDGFLKASEAVSAGFVADPLGAIRESRALLAAMTREAGVDWDSPALSAIAALAATFGGAAKPSGAGGGDVAIAVFPDEGSRLAFEAAGAQLGFSVIPAHVAAGARVLRGP